MSIDDLPSYRRLSITLNHLRIFAAVAREGRFARAAEALHVSEPTVSDQIKTLETLVGTRLVDRSSGLRRLALTQAGEILLQGSEDLFATFDNTLRRIEALVGTGTSTVVLGTGPHFGGYIFLPLYRSFRKTHPSVVVRLDVDQHWRILDNLKRRRLDLAIVVGPITDESFRVEPLLSGDLTIVGAPGHRLAGPNPATFEDLCKEPLILPDRTSGVRRVMEQMAAEHRCVLNVVLESTNLDARVQAAASGFGVAPLGVRGAEALLKSGELSTLNVEGFPAPVEWVLVWLPNHLSAAASEFKDHVQASRGELQLEQLV